MNDEIFQERLINTLSVKRHELYNLPNSRSLKNRLAYMIKGVNALKTLRERCNVCANSYQEMPADRVFSSLCDLYEKASSNQRSQIRSKVPAHFSESLLHFSWRMNIKALRERDERYLKYAVISISIEDQNTDCRESTRLTALCLHTARRIQGQTISILKDIAFRSSNKTRKLIEDFMSLPSNEGSIDRWLFVEKQVDDDIVIELMDASGHCVQKQ